MPIYALSKHERNRYYPDPNDEQTWIDYRRITLEKESEIDTLCTRNGQLDAFKKLNVMCAWGIVDWSGYGEPDGTPIPYDFKAEYEDETPGEQERKVKVIARMPRFLRREITNLMVATLVKREGDLKNSVNGSAVGRVSATGSQTRPESAVPGLP